MSPFIFAQSNTSSPYSIGGLGELAFKGNAINRHMGGLDIYSDSLHANLNNPASFGDLKVGYLQPWVELQKHTIIF